MKSALCIVIAATLLAGCARREAAEPAKSTAHAHHQHRAPHGGVLVELGEHQFNVEFLLDESRGVLQAWFLDAHAENFVRVGMPAFEATATAGGRTFPLNFVPVANAMSGETVGDTSQFESPAPWLKEAKAFDGRLKAVTVRGITFSDVAFKFSTSPDAHAHAKDAH